MGSSDSGQWMRWLQDGDAGPGWLGPLREALTRAPDPARARTLCSDVLSAAGDAIDALAQAHPERLARILHATTGVAPFLASRLRMRPQWLVRLLEDPLDAPRDADTLERGLAAALEGDDDPAAALRHFKYYELARLTVRDCSDELVPLQESGVTLRDLSRLADCLLAHALERAQRDVCARFGPARWALASGGEVELAFAVLGMGKLGAEELNYSSDVDLVYVHGAPPSPLEPAGGDGLCELSPAEYFTRIAQRFGKLVADTLPEGFLYRVDLDLRPEGAQGPLVVSEETLAAYYESWADTWEKATFMKARPVAGDPSFGWRTIRSIDPMIYRSAMDYGGVDAIRELKEKIAAAHGRRADGFNVKIDSGGIRDIEFIAQAMQLLHGGRIEQIRSRSTPDALERLRDVHLLPDERVAELRAAYDFLRRVENRLQMVAERQTHRVPGDAAARAQLARAMGYLDDDCVESFTRELEAHRARVRAVFEGFFFDHGSERIFDLFAHSVPQLLATPTTRRMLEELAAQFAREIDKSPDAQRALNNLDRFIRGIQGSRFYQELLIDRPELVPRLSAVLGGSNFLSSILATHPELIEPVFHDPDVLLLDRDQLRADFDTILAQCRAEEPRDGDGAEAWLDALRLFYHRQVLNVGLLDQGGSVSRREAEAALTEVAETCVDRAAAFARQWLRSHKPTLAEVGERTRFLVVGMGKLASAELSYGSDLDIIFLFDPEHEDDALEAQEYCSRLSQRLMSALQTKTARGSCYEVDTRLRPSGNQGTLVSSLASFERYHDRSAEVWERMVLLRARPVAGDPSLAERFEALRREILMRPLPEGAIDEVDRIRTRMEEELAQETASRRDFKRGRGGMLDVENITQWLQLEHGRAHPELLDVVPLADQLRRLGELGLLDEADREALAAGWDFLQRLSNRLRVVENRSISDLDAERGDLDAVARSLGYDTRHSGGAARRLLLTDYRGHTEAIRRVYRRIFAT